MHKNVTLVGLGLTSGYLAGRYPQETRAALRTAADRLWKHGSRTNPRPPAHERDAVSDPAEDDRLGADWSSEGGATPEGPATSNDAPV